MTEGPTLDDLANDPTRAAELSHARVLEQLARGAVAQAALVTRLAALQHEAGTLDERTRIFTKDELAARLEMPEARIRELCRAGRLPGARKLGKKWVIPILDTSLDSADSPGLTSAHDPGRGSQPPQAARPYPSGVRRPAGRAQDHRREMGGWDEGHERHDQAAAADPRAAGRPGARNAAATSGDDASSKGALT